MDYPFNVRSFFTRQEQKDIGSGLVLWRGYFQSVRPAVGKMLINIDISTGTMYKPGPLIDICLEFFEKQGQPLVLAPARGLPERERARLSRFLSGVRIETLNANGKPSGTPRTIKKLSSAGANQMSFTMREGGTLTVAQYFQRTHNRALRFPDLLCVEVGNGALIPLEMCKITEGQIMRKQVPPEKTKAVLDFATKRPPERLASIKAGLGVLQYGQSEYVRQFGLQVDEANGPLSISARVLIPPTLKYGPTSRQANIVPRDGAWNMIDKRFYQGTTIERWAIVIYERTNRFRENDATEVIAGLIEACKNVGIEVREQNPIYRYQNAQGRVADQLRAVGSECAAKNGGKFPNLLVIILPDNATDIYQAIKQINVKLGGINTIPDPRSVQILTDPHNPTMVMGADVIHPAAGSVGRPSFTAVVANVDSDTAKYIADCRVQTSRQEMIEDLESMAEIREKKANSAPKRIIFYRGMSGLLYSYMVDASIMPWKELRTD
ncbi:hypothetical protein PHLCEN_2v3882 [Hermanssonia centrifuga]|uniref:Piwi domain-containing protein n=1 Tax=Hermanssonia centrifuga TaxID=98765 RepID=A0A2R6QB76_9APHY|nr:hypothetical protein PHLCEN_2v3882 [Hermanssonia centrifuga]